MNAYGIIPARYQSSRLEGKPLALINGKPMFWHVYQHAKEAHLQEVFLATDDTRIQKVAQKYDIPCVMTRADHLSGSDRVREAAEILKLEDDAIIINIQGDEPLLKPEMLNQLIEPFNNNSNIQVTTLAHKLNTHKDEARFLSANTVKIVLAQDNKALYFSRAPIPFTREDDRLYREENTFYAHIGLYAFRHSELKAFTSLPSSSLEKKEKLEQLRLLENNIPVHVVITELSSIGVDTLEDLEKVRQIMA